MYKHYKGVIDVEDLDGNILLIELVEVHCFFLNNSSSRGWFSTLEY